MLSCFLKKAWNEFYALASNYEQNEFYVFLSNEHDIWIFVIYS